MSQPLYLIFHHGTLGDWVVTFPLWRGWHPMAAISQWSRASLAAAMLEHVQPMDAELREFVRLHMQGGPSALSPAVAELFAKAEGIISFISDGHDTWAENVRRLMPDGQHIFIDPRQPEDSQLPMAEYYANQLKAAGLNMQLTQPPASSIATGPIVIHPGSGGEPKCWPIERFATLADELSAHGQIQIVVGEAEQARWSEARMAELSRHGELIGCDRPDQLLQVLRKARLYIGNDSGPTHVAAQLGLPTVALFGPTDAQVWAPMGPAVQVIAPQLPSKMDWLQVEPVLNVVLPMLGV